jgi:hypothetical protein
MTTIGLLGYWIFGVEFQLNSLESQVAVAKVQGQFRNPEEVKCPQLEAVPEDC